MPQKQNDVWVSLVIAIALAALFLKTCDPYILCQKKTDTVVVERPVILPPDTISLTRYRAKIVYRDIFIHDTLIDTVIHTRPFTATMDTTIGCNHVKLEYLFPENEFVNLHVVTCPDTIVVTDTVITRTVTATGTFWDDVKNVGLGFIGGFVLGSIAK